MVPIRGEWTPFSDEREALAYFRKWGLAGVLNRKLCHVMVVDGYLGKLEPCKVVGWARDGRSAVIELADGLHSICAEYLAEMQPRGYKGLDLPKGMRFADILADYVVIDIETTGFSRSDDAIIEIAAARYSFGHKQSEFTSLVNPLRELPPRVVKLTGITQADVDAAPTFFQIEEDLLDFIVDKPLIGHNIVSFDYPFICAQIGDDLGSILVDTLTMSRAVFDRFHSHKLQYLKDALGLSDGTSHRAMADVDTTNALLWACLNPRLYESKYNHAVLDARLLGGSKNGNRKFSR